LILRASASVKTAPQLGHATFERRAFDCEIADCEMENSFAA
jgi:hypothetical protein